MATTSASEARQMTDEEKAHAATGEDGTRGIYIGTVSHPRYTSGDAAILRFVLYLEADTGAATAGLVFYDLDDKSEPANHYLLPSVTPPPPDFTVHLFARYTGITDTARMEARLRSDLRQVYERYTPRGVELTANAHIDANGVAVIDEHVTEDLVSWAGEVQWRDDGSCFVAMHA